MLPIICSEKRPAVLAGLILFGFLQATSLNAESQAIPVPVAADGVQRMEVTVDSYSFKPDRLIVKENVPVELILKSVTWIVPHNFVLRSSEAALEIEKEVPAGETVTIRFTPTRSGEFKFLCTKRFLFERHADKGMVGTLEVTK